MQYPAYVRREKDRRLVSFPDCPGCETFAEAEEDVYAVAHEALEAWLEGVLAARDVPPLPGMIEQEPHRQNDRLMVTVGPLLSARVQIRNRREEFGVSQQQLANTVGVTQQAIAKIESPDANVRLDTLERVAAALGLEVDLNLIPRQPSRGAAARLLLACVILACHAAPAVRLPAQPPGERAPNSPPPHSRDGSHDFDFLEGAWQLSDAPADYFTRGPFGRLVARIPAPRTATIEWYTREPDTAPESGFARMSYDPGSNQWSIHQAGLRTASPEPPLVGHFERGIGSFTGPRERDGRTVLERLTLTIDGLANARLERAFSADSGLTWERQRPLGLRRESTSPVARSPFDGTCCPSVEVIWYSVPAGKDQQIVDLFARESRAMGDSIRVQDVALLRDADRPGVFALVRGFNREKPIDDYYNGPAWTAHREALDRASIRVDSLIELMPDRLRWGFMVGERAPPDMPAETRGLVVATVYTLDQQRPEYFDFPAFWVQSVAPRIIANGARLLAEFTSEDWGFDHWSAQGHASAIPGRPVNPRRSSVVSFSWFADTASYNRYLKALAADVFWRESVMPGLTRFLVGPPATSRLVPVGRSREFRDWREMPQ